VTLNDVSRAAGVSRSTASLVLRGNSRIPEATADRVRLAMAELGYVYNRHAAAPFAITVHFCDRCNVLKFEMAFVQIKLARYLIAGEVNILQSILVEITNTDAGSVIHICNVERVDRIVLYYPVFKFNSGMFIGYKLKQGAAIFAGRRQACKAYNRYAQEFHSVRFWSLKRVKQIY